MAAEYTEISLAEMNDFMRFNGFSFGRGGQDHPRGLVGQRASIRLHPRRHGLDGAYVLHD